MSKSIGNVVDPMAVMEEWGADVVGFYLIHVGQVTLVSLWSFVIFIVEFC
jgi:valyl-tRNA synthetase